VIRSLNRSGWIPAQLDTWVGCGPLDAVADASFSNSKVHLNHTKGVVYRHAPVSFKERVGMM
jgi:hypothetical protein